eukprot:6694168-Ditylum_brightwellii.AAC.1
MKKKYDGSQPEVRSVESRPVLGSDGAQIEVGSLRGSLWEGTLVLLPGDSISWMYLINDYDGNNFQSDDEDSYTSSKESGDEDSYTSSKDSDVEDDDQNSEENDDLEEDEEDEEDGGIEEDNINMVYLVTGTETHFIIKNGKVMADEGGGSSYRFSRKQSHTAQNEKLLEDISKLVLTRSEENARPTKKS